MRCTTIVGTRPEFVQVAPVTRALRRRGHAETLVHTGQHYDERMSRVFFEELELPPPDRSLDVGSAGHGAQTGRMMIALEPVLQRDPPDIVIVYGDTNSTVAGALTAAKLHVPIAHIEAGLRSFDRRMPEEVNRVLTDHVSSLLFAPTPFAVANLAAEGIRADVHQVGDVRTDVVLSTAQRARGRARGLLERAGAAPGTPFALATIHRPSNTDDEKRLRALIDVFELTPVPVVLPVHPRLARGMKRSGLRFGPNVLTSRPLGFVDLIALLDASSVVITDSGGLQKEAYMLSRPTVTMRDTTEWIETVDAGWNRLCEPVPEQFHAAVTDALDNVPALHPDLYGAPGVGDRIVDVVESFVTGR